MATSVLHTFCNSRFRVQIRKGELRTKITKHFKDFEVDDGFVVNIPDEMAKLLGKSGEKLVYTEAAQPGERIEDDPHTDSLLRIVQSDCERVRVGKDAGDRRIAKETVFFFQLIGDGNENQRQSEVDLLRNLRVRTKGDPTAKPGVKNRGGRRN